MSDNQPVKSDFGLPLAVIGMIVCLIAWDFSRNRRLDDLERRLADLATRQSATDMKAAEALADLAALRQAILAAARNTNYLPRWTTNNTISVGRGLTFTNMPTPIP